MLLDVGGMQRADAAPVLAYDNGGRQRFGDLKRQIPFHG